MTCNTCISWKKSKLFCLLSLTALIAKGPFSNNLAMILFQDSCIPRNHMKQFPKLVFLMCSTNQLLQTSISYPLIFTIWFRKKKYAQASPMNYFKYILVTVNVFLTLSLSLFSSPHALISVSPSISSSLSSYTLTHTYTQSQPTNQQFVWILVGFGQVHLSHH